MKWIRYLKTTNIPFRTYKLNSKDSIILENKSDDSNQIIVILEGFVNLSKIFTNQEIQCVSLLSKNRIIKRPNFQRNSKIYFYQILAICPTDILSINLNQAYTNTVFTRKFLATINIFYEYTIKDYENTASILIQKNIKFKIIQLLYTISEKFGKIHNSCIIIPIYLSHEMIGKILGTNRVAITKALNELQKSNLITYNFRYIKVYNFMNLCHN